MMALLSMMMLHLRCCLPAVLGAGHLWTLYALQASMIDIKALSYVL